MANSKNYFIDSGFQVGKNSVLPLMNGEETWKEVAKQLLLAKKTIHLSFWVLESDHELIREKNEMLTSPQKRSLNTILSYLLKKKSEGVTVRLLLWEYPLTLKESIADLMIRLLGKKGGLEVIYQPYPGTILGSWHQKCIVIDNKVAFLGGMNSRKNDWDTSEHLVFDGRRAEFRLNAEERKKINSAEDYDEINPPRRDYMAMIQGPGVTDVQTNFIERWNYCLTQKMDYYKKASKINPQPRNADYGDSMVQISRTIPKYPGLPQGDFSILTTYIQAIRLAEKYIYIEDQYFRSPTIAKELASAITKNKNLLLFVVTNPDYLSEIEPGDYWKIGSISSYWTNESFNIIRGVFPQFFLFYLLSSAIIKGKRVFKSINIHSKIMIVDDEWFTLGSANINDRSFVLDGELNVSAQDKSAFEFRKRVFSNLLKEQCPDDIYQAAKLWYEHALFNYKAFKAENQPKSFVYPFAQNGIINPVLPQLFI